MRVDGGPTKNGFLMQFQSDLLGVPVVRSEVEDASAFGAFIINGFATGRLSSFEEASRLAHFEGAIMPSPGEAVSKAYEGWRKAVNTLIQ